MSKLLDYLEAFNRKERFFLFTQATGSPGVMRLGDDFRRTLTKAAGVEIPPDAKAYVDYHLDWLHAAVFLANGSPGDGPWLNKSPDGQTSVSTGNQEDVDLLVAFDHGSTTSLLLVEAKAETGWTNTQLESKARRLAKIFGHNQIPADAAVSPTFVLMSPRTSDGIITRDWPRWMLRPQRAEGSQEYAWLAIHVPRGRMMVQGCDANGDPSSNRTHWQVKATGVRQDASR